MKRSIILAAVLAAALAAVGCHKKKSSGFEFGEVKRADIQNIVSSTGQMEPVNAVDVGTQVSGTVAQVLVDYNARVKAGQLLAVLDTSNLAAAVHDAEAGLARAKAANDIAQNTLLQTRQLFAKGLSSPYDTQAAYSGAVSSAASLQSAQAALDRARVNLGYAYVRSPINGTVIDRNVEPGQTVAANFSAPILFVVSEDLSRMRILAQVDESDIGSIDSGLPVKFTVQAYPDLEFDGTAEQVRLEPTTTSGVVTYTVVVSADNKDGKLLPGMTATVDFYVQQRTGVLTVPNAALKFRPTEAMLAQMRKARGESGRDSAGRQRRNWGGDSTRPGFAAGDSSSRRQLPTDVSMLWYQGPKGEPQVLPVKVGITDGTRTEVTPLRGDLPEGTKVYTKGGATGTSSSSSGFRGPPGGMFGMPPPGR